MAGAFTTHLSLLAPAGIFAFLAWEAVPSVTPQPELFASPPATTQSIDEGAQESLASPLRTDVSPGFQDQRTATDG